MPPRGFEPPTNGLGNRCSIHLSYGGDPGNVPGSTRRVDPALVLEHTLYARRKALAPVQKRQLDQEGRPDDLSPVSLEQPVGEEGEQPRGTVRQPYENGIALPHAEALKRQAEEAIREIKSLAEESAQIHGAR